MIRHKAATQSSSETHNRSRCSTDTKRTYISLRYPNVRILVYFSSKGSEGRPQGLVDTEATAFITADELQSDLSMMSSKLPGATRTIIPYSRSLHMSVELA